MLHQNNGGVQKPWSRRRRRDGHQIAAVVYEPDEAAHPNPRGFDGADIADIAEIAEIADIADIADIATRGRISWTDVPAVHSVSHPFARQADRGESQQHP